MNWDGRDTLERKGVDWKGRMWAVREGIDGKRIDGLE